jgi:hypothetical protein
MPVIWENRLQENLGAQGEKLHHRRLHRPRRRHHRVRQRLIDSSEAGIRKEFIEDFTGDAMIHGPSENAGVGLRHRIHGRRYGSADHSGL